MSTRAWIVTAFNRFVLGKSYDSLSVGELSRRAGVGRTTFYEHFRDKDDVLRQALTPVLAPLAEAAVGIGDARRVHAVLEHLLENRARVLEMLNGPARQQVETTLAGLVHVLLNERRTCTDGATQRLEAARCAGATIAVIQAWLGNGKDTCTLAQVAAVLVDASREAPPRQSLA